MAKILLVDDEERFVAGLARVLGNRGHQVLTAEGGEAALKLLKSEAVEVMVLDLKMPGMDGIATLRRAKEQKPQVEVILLTGHGDLAAARLAIELGAFDFLLKPCEIPELVEKIQAAANGRGLRPPRP